MKKQTYTIDGNPITLYEEEGGRIAVVTSRGNVFGYPHGGAFTDGESVYEVWGVRSQSEASRLAIAFVVGSNACVPCACLEMDIAEPRKSAYYEGWSFCPDCEAYYGVADDLETRDPYGAPYGGCDVSENSRKPEKVGHLCEGCEAILVIPESNIWAICPECGVSSWCEDHTAESFATRVVLAEVEEL